MFRNTKLGFAFITCFLLFGSIFSGHAQESKTAVYDKIGNSYAWINRAFLEHSATLTLTNEQWDYALKHENVGLETLSSLGSDMARYFKILSDPRIMDDCSYGKDKPDCEERVAALAPQLKVEADFSRMKMTPDRFKLAMYALATISGFLGSNNLYGPESGWRPKANTIKITLIIDDGSGQPVVTWNADKSAATVKMFVASEAGDWAANMMKGLEKGGSK